MCKMDIQVIRSGVFITRAIRCHLSSSTANKRNNIYKIQNRHCVGEIMGWLLGVIWIKPLIMPSSSLMFSVSNLSQNNCLRVGLHSHMTSFLTHRGRVTHICVSKLTIIGSDNGLSPGRRQAIIWTNAGILLIRTLGTNFREILGKIHSIPFKKRHLKMSSAKGRLFSLGLN